MPIQRKHDFRAGTKISSDQVDEEFNQLVSQVNQVESDLLAKETDIRTKAQMLKITNDDGGVSIFANLPTDDILQRILSKGVGLHTFYAVTGSKNLPPSGISIRGVAQLTTANFGWIWCIDYQNQMWTNYLDNNVWRGWARLADHTQERLWSGIAYPDANQTIKPSKKLSECRTGWILVWSDYDYSVGSNDIHWAFTHIPKSFASFDKGGGFFASIVNYMSDTTVDNTGKYLYINDGDITGADFNKQEANRSNDVCLRFVYEY
jgi:hypothetical protein